MSRATGPPAGLLESSEVYRPIHMDAMHMPMAVNRRFRSPTSIAASGITNTNSAYNCYGMSGATGPPLGLFESFEQYILISMDAMHMPIVANQRLHFPHISSSIRHKLV